MSKAFDKLLAIKKLLFNTETQEPAPAETPAPVAVVEPITKKLQDGTEIKISKLEVGGAVTIADAPATVGVYTLDDASTIEVDAAGNIIAITPAAVAPTETEIDMSQPNAVKSLFEKFATGSPEERIANLETVAKALFEDRFGWQLREAQDKANRDAAIKVYQETLATAQKSITDQGAVIETQAETLRAMYSLVEVLVTEPKGETPPQKSTFSFSQVEDKTTSLGRKMAALDQLREKKEKKTA